MATIVTRAGKGSALTHTEVDANFTNLNTDKVESSALATVATTGAYSDLTGTPTLATVATTGAYSDLSGTPTLATVATTGAYSDLSGTPTIPTDFVSAASGGTFTGNVDFSAGIDVTGNVTVTGTVDGRDIATNIPSSLGTAGQFLAVNSGASATEWVDAPASGTHNFTASGALANGDLVAVNSDGTVSVISGGSATSTLGTEAVFNSANTGEPVVAYDANAQKVVVAYKDGSPGRSLVGTVSGTTITWDTGNEATFETGSTNYLAITYDANAQKIVIAYADGGDSDKGKAVVGTVSGTAISFGSPVTFNSAVTESISIAYDENAQKVVIAYADFGNSTYGTAIVGTVSGTSISFGSEVVFESATSQYTSITYDTNAQKIVISYEDAGNSLYGTAVVGTVSGTSISFGSPVVFNSARAEKASITYDENAQKVVVAYPDSGNSEYGTAKVGTVSGTSISFGSASPFRAAATARISASYDANAEKVIISYLSSGDGLLNVGTVSGTSITFSSTVTFESDTANPIKSTYDASAQKIIIVYTDEGNSNYGTGIAYQAGFNNTNLTSENYIGISDGAYADAATATVQLAGAVDDAQSGLTAGQAYYVQTDGTLSTTADSPSVFAGTAVSATKIIVKG